MVDSDSTDSMQKNLNRESAAECQIWFLSREMTFRSSAAIDFTHVTSSSAEIVTYFWCFEWPSDDRDLFPPAAAYGKVVAPTS